MTLLEFLTGFEARPPVSRLMTITNLVPETVTGNLGADTATPSGSSRGPILAIAAAGFPL